jgi:hypothetical protein
MVMTPQLSHSMNILYSCGIHTVMQCYVGKQRGILSNVLCYGVFMSKFAFETARAVRGKGHADTSLINVLKDETRNVRD